MSYTISAAVFLFFALMLSVPRGYNVGAVMLLLSSIVYLVQRPQIRLSRQSKWLIFWLFAMFITGTFSTLYHGNPINDLDIVSRYLLAIPIFLLFLAHPPRLEWLWAGLIVGCVSAAGVTYWETAIDGQYRAFGHTGAIQFGDLALVMGVFCAAAAFWALKKDQGRILWLTACIVGATCGLYASILSGSRGGWIALPAIVILFCFAFLRQHNVKWAILAFVALSGISIAVVSTVPSVMTRYEQAKHDIELYQQGNSATSIGARLAIWDATIQLIKTRPINGWADTEYRTELERLVERKKADPIVLRLANVHNNYLETWVFTGFPGLVAMLGLFIAGGCVAGSQLRSAARTQQVLALCSASLIACYAIFSLSQNMLERNNTLLFFCIAFVLFQGSIIRTPHAGASTEVATS